LKDKEESGKRAEAKDPVDVFIHGMVYDLDTGRIFDLGVSTGPPGKKIPPMPFPRR
jgi:carbonic anhydrase